MEQQMIKLYFVSNNKEKFQEIKGILEQKEEKNSGIVNIEVEWKMMDIPELQTDSVEKLIKQKALVAFKEIHRPLIVEHTALRINAFNNLPDLQTRHFYVRMGYKAIVDYCNYKQDFDAAAETILCYCDGRRFFVEKAEEKGEIKKDVELFGDSFDWDIFFCPSENNKEKKTYAELGTKKNDRSMRKKACEKLRKQIVCSQTGSYMSISNDNEIKELADLIKKRKVLLFLGAGISASIGFPTWNGLIEKLGKREGFEKELFELYGNNMMLAEYADYKNNVYELLKETFTLEGKENIQKLLYKSDIYKALYELDFPVVYTTNYDHLLEEYYREKRHKYIKVVNIEDMNKINVFDRDNTRIMKFHGDIDDEESIVLSESEYFGRMNFQSFMDVQFQADILQYHVLYLGYSLSDINIKLMLYLAGKRWKDNKDIKKSYIFTSTPNEVQEVVFKKNGITMITGKDADKEKSTREFLERILEIIK